MAATNSVVIDGACRLTIDASSTAGVHHAARLCGFADWRDRQHLRHVRHDYADGALRHGQHDPGKRDADQRRRTAADRLEAILDATPTGTVVDDKTLPRSATAFKTNLTEASDNHYNGAFLRVLLRRAARPVAEDCRL